MLGPAALAFSAAGRASYAWRTLTSAARFLASSVVRDMWVPVLGAGASVGVEVAAVVEVAVEVEVAVVEVVGDDAACGWLPWR